VVLYWLLFLLYQPVEESVAVTYLVYEDSLVRVQEQIFASNLLLKQEGCLDASATNHDTALLALPPFRVFPIRVVFSALRKALFEVIFSNIASLRLSITCCLSF
jgi:hypothetical protein